MKRCALALCVAAFLALPAAAQERYWVEMDDGILLATNVYEPESDGPWPAILIRTIYEIDRSDMVAECELYRANGIACAIQTERGFGESEGELNLMTEGEDGRTAVAWIAEQSWCNGVVGTAGLSSMGEAQYRLAPGAPDVLRCIAPRQATPDFYHFLFRGGAFREAMIMGIIDALDLDVTLSGRLLNHTWDPLQPLLFVDQITVPGLHIGGWWDVHNQGILDGFSITQEHGGNGGRGQQKLIMGPWVHGAIGGTRYIGQLTYPENSQLDVATMYLQWQNYWLMAEESGVDQWPNALVYLMGAAPSFYVGIPVEPNAPGNVWVELDGWPPPAVDLSLHLGQTGTLGRTFPHSGQLELLIDPANPVPNKGGTSVNSGAGPYDQREVEARDDVLVFTTDELSHPLTVMGRVSVNLWIIPDTTDLDLAVRFSDVYPGGQSMLVLEGIQRARMRCSDEYECFLTPGEPTEIVVDLWSTAMVFNRGHRVRISVSGSSWPAFEVNPNHGGDLDGDEAGIVARPQILFGADYPSRLVLPVPITEPRRLGGRIGGTAP